MDEHTPSAREVIELLEHIVQLQEKAHMHEEEFEVRIVAKCGGVDFLCDGELNAHFHLTPELMELCGRVATVFGVIQERILMILCVHVLRDAAEGMEGGDDPTTGLPEGVTLQ